MQNKRQPRNTFIIIVVIVASITFSITFGMAISYIKQNPDKFTVQIKESAIIKPGQKP